MQLAPTHVTRNVPYQTLFLSLGVGGSLVKSQYGAKIPLLVVLASFIVFFTIWDSRLRYSWISSSNLVLLSTKSWSSFALLSRDLFSHMSASNLVTNTWNAFSNTESLSWTGFLVLVWIPWMMCVGKYSRICSRLQSLCNQVKALAVDFCSVWMCWQTNVKKRTPNASICTERKIQRQ